jgi:predicted RNase H-like HicB family nuclease
MAKPLLIQADWDDDAKVWVAISDDVPGLATEAETLEYLIEKLKVMVPELLDLNGYPGDDETTVPFEVVAKRASAAPRHV